MFTIKAYKDSGRMIIKSAESFTILRSDHGEAEVTLHQRNAAEDTRIDVKHELDQGEGLTPVFDKIVIENEHGRTTEIIRLGPNPAKGKMYPGGPESTKAGSRDAPLDLRGQ